MDVVLLLLIVLPLGAWGFWVSQRGTTESNDAKSQNHSQKSDMK
ncbi:MAG: hypothetical protein WCH01_07880 [Methylococcaceae bacterium]